MIERIIHWVIEDLTWGGVLFGASLFLATIIGSILVVGVLLVKLPTTYFQDFHSRDFWVDRHPVLRLTARGGKNVLGATLVILALPGVPRPGHPDHPDRPHPARPPRQTSTGTDDRRPPEDPVGDKPAAEAIRQPTSGARQAAGGSPEERPLAELLTLREAQVVSILDPEELRESEVRGLKGTFHFIESRGVGETAKVGGL
jgi:hypothetical protein